MKNVIFSILLIIPQFAFSQAQHINYGQFESIGHFYEVLNEFSPKNHPGNGTKKQLVWKSQDNIYVYGNDNSSYYYGNSSFWVFNLTLKQWKCIQDNDINVNFGVKGVYNSTNTPGKRSQSITFIDNEGNLYLWGGTGIDYTTYTIPYNDLWKYDVSIQQWAWIGGADNAGNYGAIGIESDLFFPSARIDVNPILSNDGMLFFYGGYYRYSNKFDLWKYNPNNNSWTLLFLPSDNMQNIGNIGVEDINNKPGVLIDYTSWFYNNNLYIFGGTTESSTCIECVQKKIWKFNLATNLWACIKNPNTIDAIYGTQNISDIDNTPPSLENMSNAIVLNNEVYFFGGYEKGEGTDEWNKGLHNSLWRYNLITNEWTWLKGKQLTNHPGFFGKKGVERIENMPASRLNSFLWNDGNIIKLFGGSVYNSFMNYSQDFWDYKIETNNFIWKDGLSSAYQHTSHSPHYYYEDLNTPSVYNLAIPGKLKWGEKGEKLWFFIKNLQPFLGSTPLGGMFEYDVTTSTCHKIKEFALNPYNSGIYGQLNVPDILNIPPYRTDACLWENETNLYLLGGSGNTIYYNDFWTFDKTTKNWTWINGSKNDETPYFFYSDIGVANQSNFPKCRRKALTWVDAEGDLWLFSGNNNSFTGGLLHDFWKFDVSDNVWILMGGDQNEISTISSDDFLNNYPPYVNRAATWSKGNDLYFYGGHGLGQGTWLSRGLLSDIWKYSISGNSWTNISGNRKININGNYGIKGYGFVTNVPGSRENYVTWSDDYGNLWLYGGEGKGTSGSAISNLFDLWKYDLSLNLWIWMDGLNTQPIWFDPIFDAYNYYLPRRVGNYSLTFKGNGKHYLANTVDSPLWEFDFSFYNNDYNVIEGTARFNENNNCDSNDISVPNLKLKINNINENLFYTNVNGYYKIYTSFQNNTLDVGIGENNNFFNIDPLSSTINFSSYNESYVQDFCVSPNGTINDLEIIVVPVNDARPGFDNYYKIIYRNKGNTTLSGSVQLSYNEDINDFVSSSITPSSQIAGQLEWNFTNLLPFESRTILVTFNLNSPQGIPPVNGGDIINFTGLILPLEGDASPVDNSFWLRQLVVNSYDPNDKICFQGEQIFPEMVGEYVTYRIRFENEGNGDAINVVIKDIIDTTKFILESIVSLDASHPYRMTLTQGNKVEFFFENINLPFDEDNNDGYVIFKIKTKDNLVLGDVLKNQAEIYFDYNFPINTNEYSTTISDKLGLYETHPNIELILYPNPVNDLLYIQTKEYIKKAELYDLSGRIILVFIGVENNQINLNELPSGNYLLRIQTEKGSKVEKIVKE